MGDDGTEWICLDQYRASGGGIAWCLWNKKQEILN